MSHSGDPVGILATNILAPPAISNRLHSYRSLHSDPGGLSVYRHPPLAAFVGSGIPPPLAAISGFAGASLPGSPPFLSVHWPNPKEEVLISPCSHCGSSLLSLVSFVGHSKSHSGGPSAGHSLVSGYHGGRSLSSSSGGHRGPASSSPLTFCHGGSDALAGNDSVLFPPPRMTCPARSLFHPPSH
jgi:hypothetical protein